MLSRHTFRGIGSKEFQLFGHLLIDQSLTSFDELVLALASNGFDIDNMSQVNSLRLSFAENFQLVIEALHLALYGGIYSEKLRNIKMLTEIAKFKLSDGGTLIAGTSAEMAAIVSRLAVNFTSAIAYSESYGEVLSPKDEDYQTELCYAYIHLLHATTEAQLQMLASERSPLSSSFQA